MSALTTEVFRAIGRSDAISAGDVVATYLGDLKRRVSVARVDSRLYAFDDLCSCAAPPCPLSGGLLEGTTIMCQCHGSRFDIGTGAVVEGPATEAIRVYAVHEAGGSVFILL